MAMRFGLRGLKDGNGNLAWDATRPMEASGLRGIASGGIAAPAPARPTGLRRTGIFENGREWKGTSGTAGRGWAGFQNTPEAQSVRHNAGMNAIRASNAEAIRNRQGIRTLGTSSGAEAAAYAKANPSLGSGSSVFGRNDREAAMQRNRDFIRSGRASMFGPRPATTKGITALREADYKDRELANQRHLEGLRQRGAIEKERVTQEGQTGIERLRLEGENHKTDALANYNQKVLDEQRRQFDATMDAQAKNADAALAALRTPKPPSPEEVARQQYEADKLHYGSEAWDPSHGANGGYYYIAGEGDQAKRVYYGDQANNERIDDWTRKNMGRFNFDDNYMTWVATDDQGNTRIAPGWAGEQLTNHWSNTADGAVRTSAGTWKNHGIGVNTPVANHLNNNWQREQAIEALVRNPQSPFSQGQDLGAYNLMVDAYNNPYFLARNAEVPQGWRPADQEDQARLRRITGRMRDGSQASAGLSDSIMQGLRGMRPRLDQPEQSPIPASGGGLERLSPRPTPAPSPVGVDEEFVTANRPPIPAAPAPKPQASAPNSREYYLQEANSYQSQAKVLMEERPGLKSSDIKPVMMKNKHLGAVPISWKPDGQWRELTAPELKSFFDKYDREKGVYDNSSTKFTLTDQQIKEWIQRIEKAKKSSGLVRRGSAAKRR